MVYPPVIYLVYGLSICLPSNGEIDNSCTLINHSSTISIHLMVKQLSYSPTRINYYQPSNHRISHPITMDYHHDYYQSCFVLYHHYYYYHYDYYQSWLFSIIIIMIINHHYYDYQSWWLWLIMLWLMVDYITIDYIIIINHQPP